LFVNQIKANKPLTVTDPSMTRFLMSLEDSVNLVIYAFENARQGDIFVQKAPASTMGDLAQAVRDVFSSKAVVKIIGTRHGEKLYESLLSREEMARAQDLDEYYRVPADDRDLNYNKYFIEGETKVSAVEDYTSHNTVRLDVDKVKALLMKLDFIQDELDA
jgi:UDP-glucose 4-epimerase